MTDYTSYFICTAPRSGSTMLCRLLRATGVAGNPRAFFHRSTLASWAETNSTSLDPNVTQVEQAKTILELAKMQSRSGGDLFGARLQGHSLAFFLKTLCEVHPKALSNRERIERSFGKTCFLYLNRADKIDQALSYVRAQQTGLWHMASDGSEIERLSPPKAPVYDFAQIFEAYNEMCVYDRIWRDWFKREGIVPYDIEYTDLSTAPDATFKGILHAINAPEVTKMPAADTARLADAETERWRNLFVRDLAQTRLG